ncbi:DNA cytosine methyltransferase [Solidesulfovibrio sp. C21]|uniref:DNA cytosine methyltransferase n=1 Tax=Solidesulfovibrio sp. C21 TaxID=3398613 RepID=UPI0039FC254C
MYNPLNLPVVDLFAGAGGFAVASRMAGCDVRLSVEFDSKACATLRANNLGKDHVIEERDVRDLVGEDIRVAAKVGRSDPLIVVGGPPCQPFSKASYWTDPGFDAHYRRARARGEEAKRPEPIWEAKDDDRRDLLKEFWRLVVESRADAFVMENVRSLIHPRNRGVLHSLLSAFQYAGYNCTMVDADATAYGIPQKRQRIFVIGSRRTMPIAPKQTHSSDQSTGLPTLVGVGEVIAPYAGNQFFEKGEVVEGKWADQLREIPPGWNYKYLTAWANHPEPVFEAETRFWNFLLKLAPDAPSWTINANPGPWVGPFHWTSRRLRTPELAAIQTFPNGYTFTGSRRDRVRQIGNAVPPLLASKMVSAAVSSLFVNA